MKPTKIGIFLGVLLMLNFYAWYYFARVIDEFADEAAALIIVDTLSANNANDIKKLRELRLLIQNNQLEEAGSQIEDAIDSKLYILESCLR